MRLQLPIWISIVLFLSCRDTKSSNSVAFYEKENTGEKILDKVYLFSPFIDSTLNSNGPGCDCCTSNLALLSDSSFFFVSYCVDGDTFWKGKITRQGGDVFLNFDSITVIQSFGFLADTAYEVEAMVGKIAKLEISNFQSKPLLILNENGTPVYGVEDSSNTFNSILASLPDSIASKFRWQVTL